MMTDTRFFGMRRSAVTVSTVGVIPRILQMADDLPGVSLALSLHAPNQVSWCTSELAPLGSTHELSKSWSALVNPSERVPSARVQTCHRRAGAAKKHCAVCGSIQAGQAHGSHRDLPATHTAAGGQQDNGALDEIAFFRLHVMEASAHRPVDAQSSEDIST